VRIVVVGAGVLGLTAAHELAAAGHRVRIVAERPADASVSGVAAAIWFPHDVGLDDSVWASADVTFRRLTALATEGATGVRMRKGIMLFRHSDPDLSWTTSVPGHRLLSGSEAPPGATGVECTLPLVVTNVYLDWLRARVLSLGVSITSQRVRDVDELLSDEPDCEAVVVAAGLGSGALLGDDDEVYPIRGQVVRVANPGLTDWVIDGGNPAGLTYVVPRDHDVVCGGTDDIGSYDETPHPDIEAAILERTADLVPALRGQPVLSRAAGLRPGRPTVRLEVVSGHRAPVIAAYGHGGAGFTLSWGDAATVVRLVEGTSSRLGAVAGVPSP
jgi:D-amino-acid oxidase